MTESADRDNRVEDSSEDELRELPTGLAVALRLRRSGATDADIAVALGIEIEAVPAALHVAHAKLAALRRPGTAT